ncbi:MAG: HAMP domain-containing protein [Candidatus Promineifilaceae bacterium]
MEKNPASTDQSAIKESNENTLIANIPPLRWLVAMRRKLKIGPKLVIGFGILIALMLVGYGWGIYSSSLATQEINRTTNLRAPTALASARAQAHMLELVADLQGYLALGDAQYKDSYAAKQIEFESDLAELETIISQAEVQDSADYIELADNLANLRSNYDQWSALVPQLFELRDDQLRREPALRLLIVDATPHINTVIVNSESMITSQEGRDPTTENLEVMGEMANFESSFYAMVAGLRGYVTTGRDSFKFEYSANFDANEQAWENLSQKRDLLSSSQLANYETIEVARESFLAFPEQMFTAVEGERAREDLYLFRTEAVPLAEAMMLILQEETMLQQNLLQSELNTGREQLSTAQIVSIAGAVTVLLAGILLAWLIGRDIARPIVRLTDTAQQIHAGDLAAQAEVTTEDEIGILGNTFNEMTSKLRQTLESLLDYLEQVKVVMGAAAAVEEDRFEPSSLDELAERDDALGQLARVFQKMAREVRIREEKLKQQVIELKIVLDESRQSKKVSEITESDYFKSLKSEADDLRGIISGSTDSDY